MLTIDDVIERFDGSLAYSTNSKEICQYIADLLKELKERRKETEIATGEWELKDHQWECDKCGCRINVKNPLDCDKWNYYYCPHCGTKMLIAVQRGR